jgi:alpha,alpha-trehalase
MFMLLIFEIFALYFFNLINGNCDSEIYCRGPILEKIQMSGLFADSKQFVDMPTSKSKAVVIKEYGNKMFSF